MKINPQPKFDGPIPGENLTADTRNYPWHRPPEYAGYDEAISGMLRRLDSRKEGELIYSLIELDVPVYIITSNFLMRHIMRGFISIDTAILMSGPIARMIEIIGKNNGQKPDMTTEDPKDTPITPTMLRLQMGDVKAIDDLVGNTAPKDEDGPGLMTAAPEDIVEVAPEEEQAAMLGMAADNEEETV